MNFKTTIALIIVLAGLGVYLFVNRSSTPSATPSPAEAHKLIDIKPEEITSLSVTPANGKPTSFEKTGADWQMTSPMKTAADYSKVEDLVTTLLGLESHGQLDASQKAANGLDQPDYTVAIGTKDHTIKLLVGDKPPIGDTLAVLLDGKDKPDVVDVALFASLDKKPSSYRKTHLINATSDEIMQVEITRGSQTLKLEKAGGNWTIAGSQPVAADSSAIDTLLSAITNLTAVSFDDIDTPADAGLAKPRTTVWISTAAPSTQPTSSPPAGTTIKLGGYEDVSQKNILASVDDGPIVTLAASTLDSFKKTPLELRDKSVVSIDPDAVESFTLEATHAASTQPAILPSHHIFQIIRRPNNALLGPTLPTTAATTAPSTQPSSIWMFADKSEANDTQVKALLDVLHPLKAESFLATVPTTQPGTVYLLKVQTGPSAGAAPTQYQLRLIDPGADQKLIGSFEDLSFQADHALITSFQADFTPAK